MAKKVKTTNIPKKMEEKIPYTGCFEEEGLFEIKPGTYSKAYAIKDLSPSSAKGFNNEVLVKKFSKLLNELPSTVSAQFIIHNKLIPLDKFLENVLISKDKSDAVNKWIDKYDAMITDNCNIGHNNVRKDKYFVLSTNTDVPDEAVLLFKTIDTKIKELFADIYGIKVEGMSVEDRLRVMYSMFNPNRNDFGKKADLRGTGSFSLKDMKKLKFTTKDCIAPISFDTSNKNYMVLNDEIYVRTLFITSLPVVLSNNLIADITNISSNMVFSCIYEPVDSQYGFDTVTQAVSENTIVKQANKRDTIKDRRDKAVIKTEVLINQTEDAYFGKCALETFKTSVAMGEKAMMCSFVIALYADDLEILDRDTKLLRMSASKFACQVKPLDYQQLEGFQSVLPLCDLKVDVRRMFTINKLASAPPLNIQEVMQKNGVFNGLNTINDNLILFNRKNNPVLSGIIAGTDHSGKTFQQKREIFNALISTNDKIVVFSDKDEYDGFVTELGGQVIDIDDHVVSPFFMIDHYGLMNVDRYSKSLALDALFEVMTRPEGQVISDTQALDDSKDERAEQISKEVESLLKSAIDISNTDAVVAYLTENTRDYPTLSGLIEEISAFKMTEALPIESDKKIILFKVHSLTQKIVMLDFFFNMAIKDKQNNITDWLFVDSIDELLSSEQTALFLNDYIEKMDALQDVMTMVIQSSVRLFTDNASAFRLEDLLNLVGYYKLLNQGAIERKKYTEILNIGNTLVNYITSAELGKGIILTSASNYAFDDNFYSQEEQENSFYALFKV